MFWGKTRGNCTIFVKFSSSLAAWVSRCFEAAQVFRKKVLTVTELRVAGKDFLSCERSRCRHSEQSIVEHLPVWMMIVPDICW